LSTLREFLYERVYDNPVVHNELAKAEGVLNALWAHFVEDQPESFRQEYWPAGVKPEEPIERAVGDFLAGMTDRYALRLYETLFLPKRWKGL
jgi:dGTPase